MRRKAPTQPAEKVGVSIAWVICDRCHWCGAARRSLGVGLPKAMLDAGSAGPQRRPDCPLLLRGAAIQLNWPSHHRAGRFHRGPVDVRGWRICSASLTLFRLKNDGKNLAIGRMRRRIRRPYDRLPNQFAPNYFLMMSSPHGGKGTRTPGLLDAIETLYQLSYAPDTVPPKYPPISMWSRINLH